MSATTHGLLKSMDWVFDAPLFIDDELVFAYHESVVMPQASVLLEEHFSQSQQHMAVDVRGEIEASASPGWLADTLLGKLFSAKVGVRGEAGVDVQTDSADSKRLVIRQVDSAHRRLVHLAAWYMAQHPSRVQFVSITSKEVTAVDGEGKNISETWADESRLSEMPRLLTFLDIVSGSDGREIPIVPMAAEYKSGFVDTIFRRLKGPDDNPLHTDYPQPSASTDKGTLLDNRRGYWRNFMDHFDAIKSMNAVEDGRREEQKDTDSGPIHWIDYRVPIGVSGDTLHLHFEPRGRYPVGTFAYNLVKRGSGHGLRLIGTLKSEPDLNVLAAYEK